MRWTVRCHYEALDVGSDSFVVEAEPNDVFEEIAKQLSGWEDVDDGEDFKVRFDGLEIPEEIGAAYYMVDCPYSEITVEPFQEAEDATEQVKDATEKLMKKLVEKQKKETEDSERKLLAKLKKKYEG
jgi:hypothetical protein